MSYAESTHFLCKVVRLLWDYETFIYIFAVIYIFSVQLNDKTQVLSAYRSTERHRLPRAHVRA